MVNKNAIVTEVSVDGLTIQYQPAHFDIDTPVQSEHGILHISAHTQGVLTLPEPQSMEPGEHLCQPKMLAAC